jgi:hypothetical protein
VSGVLLTAIFIVARRLRIRHGFEFPGDTYAILEAAAWIGIYLLANLPLSRWLSFSDGGTTFYWSTYVATWALPMIGLWMAIRDRQRLMLDVSIAMAIVTLITNREYLNRPRHSYDPIAFGVLLIVVGVGLRRWLVSGEGGSRNGWIADRILDSERQRLGVVATGSVVHQGPVATHAAPTVEAAAAAPPAPPPIGGGGRSGGGGASGTF